MGSWLKVAGKKNSGAFRSTLNQSQQTRLKCTKKFKNGRQALSLRRDMLRVIDVDLTTARGNLKEAYLSLRIGSVTGPNEGHRLSLSVIM